MKRTFTGDGAGRSSDSGNLYEPTYSSLERAKLYDAVLGEDDVLTLRSTDQNDEFVSPVVTVDLSPLVDLSAVNDALLTKANQTSLDSLEADLGIVESDIISQSASISALDSTILLKADLTALSAVDDRLVTAESAIIVNAGAIDLKATVVEVSDLETRMGNAEVAIDAVGAPSITLQTQKIVSQDSRIDLSDINSLSALMDAYENNGYVDDQVAIARINLTSDIISNTESIASITSQIGTITGDYVALIDSESSARIAGDYAQSLVTDALTVRLDDEEAATSASSSAVSALTTRVSNAEGNIVSSANDIVSLESRIDTEESTSSALASAADSLTTRVTIAEGAISSSASDITSLESRVTTEEGTSVSLANAASALTTRVDVVEGTITSQASSITDLETTVGGHTTSISTNLSSINGVRGSYGVAINNNGHISGFGLVSALVDGGAVSDFNVLADNFYIRNAAGSGAVAPFTVSGNNVYIDNAAIQNAAIVEAKIGNLAVTEAKIGSAAITEAKIGSAAITEAKIGSAAVTEAKIGTAAVTAAKIGTAAITEAKIASAAITEAKIGTAAVDTLKIAGNAVTIPAVQTRTNFLIGNNTFVEANNQAITMPEAGTLLVLYHARLSMGVDNPADTYNFVIDVDGTEIENEEYVVPTDLYHFAWSGPVSAGLHTVNVDWQGEETGGNTIDLRTRTLMLYGNLR